MVAIVGRHLLEAYARKQKITARSRAEAEQYAAAWGASEAKEVQSMMCDLGFGGEASVDHRRKSNRTHSSFDMESAKMSNQTGWESVGSRARTILRTSGRKRSAITSSEHRRHPWGTLMLKRT